MADLPIDLGAGLTEQLARILDVEAKIPRALEALGPVGGRDVLLLDGDDGIRARQLTELGGRVTFAASNEPAGFAAPDDSADVVVSLWTPFREGMARDTAEAGRVLRDGGRLLVVHDYGRDDISRLRGDRPEYGLWSRRDGPFLNGGFKVRIVHCFWTFESVEVAAAFLESGFGAVGRQVAAAMKRPRLSYNVAVYHRTFGTDG
ncbi:MAG: class I SAM-dependent methyltransferase [Thermoplasmata archaeon]|nr:class I SAM-dependent methyltransferase [Thermoplasmata archaeon]